MPPVRIIIATLLVASVSLVFNVWVYGWTVVLAGLATVAVLLPVLWWLLKGATL